MDDTWRIHTFPRVVTVIVPLWIVSTVIVVDQDSWVENQNRVEKRLVKSHLRQF